MSLSRALSAALLERQEISSADTSLNQVPALLKQIPVQKGGVNADIGGGKYDKGTSYLAKKGVKNHVIDPYNRSAGDNASARKAVSGGKADTATVANTLNVIKEPGERSKVIAQAAAAVGKDGVAYFSVYEGDGSGKGRQTPKGWQENRPLASYEAEIKRHFKRVVVKGGRIEASQKEPETSESTADVLAGAIAEGFVKQHGEQWCVHNEPTGLVVKTKSGPRCYDSRDKALQVWYRLDCKHTGRKCGSVRANDAADAEVSGRSAQESAGIGGGATIGILDALGSQPHLSFSQLCKRARLQRDTCVEAVRDLLDRKQIVAYQAQYPGPNVYVTAARDLGKPSEWLYALRTASVERNLKEGAPFAEARGGYYTVHFHRADETRRFQGKPFTTSFTVQAASEDEAVEKAKERWRKADRIGPAPEIVIDGVRRA